MKPHQRQPNLLLQFRRHDHQSRTNAENLKKLKMDSNLSGEDAEGESSQVDTEADGGSDRTAKVGIVGTVAGVDVEADSDSRAREVIEAGVLVREAQKGATGQEGEVVNSGESTEAEAGGANTGVEIGVEANSVVSEAAQGRHRPLLLKPLKVSG